MFSYPPDLPPALKLCMRQFNVITMGIYSDITLTFSMYISTSKLGANLNTAFSLENWFSFCVNFLSGTSGLPLPVCDVGGSPLKTRSALVSVSNSHLVHIAVTLTLHLHLLLAHLYGDPHLLLVPGLQPHLHLSTARLQQLPVVSDGELLRAGHRLDGWDHSRGGQHLGKASRKKSPELSGIFPKRGGGVKRRSFSLLFLKTA